MAKRKQTKNNNKTPMDKELSDKEIAEDQWFPEFRLDDFLFPQQLAFVRDENPFRTAVCSRRSGKTTACAADLIDICLRYPEATCLYATLTRGMAKRVLWPELKRINREFGLNGEENQTELTMTFPGESTIALLGAGTLDQIDKFRGVAIRRVYVDEAQGFRHHLKEMCDDVFGPALFDYAGHLVMIGTPSAIPAGYFHDCAVKNNEWSHHKWTFFDNPHIATKSKLTHMQLLERELKRRGVTIDDPSIRREFFGEWVLDTNSLLLHYVEAKNHNEIPDLDPTFSHIIGVRLSTDNTTAIVVLAWSAQTPITYLVEECTPTNQTLDGLDNEIKRMMEQYNVIALSVDSEGTGKDLVDALKQRYSLPFEQADVNERLANYRLLDNSLQNGTFKAHKDSQFAEDCCLIERDNNHSTPGRTVVSGHSDTVDAVLVAFRKSPAYAYIKPEEKKSVLDVDWDYQFKYQQETRERANGISWETDKQGVPEWLKWGKE